MEKRTETIYMRVLPSTKAMATEKAREEGRTMSNYIETLIRQDCENKRKEVAKVKFYSFDLENMKEAVDEYCKYEENPGRWIVASPSLYSSEGNRYIVDRDYHHKPTTEDLEALANEDWEQFYRDVDSDAEERKEEIIEQLLGDYTIVDRESFTRTNAEQGCDE